MAAKIRESANQMQSKIEAKTDQLKNTTGFILRVSDVIKIGYSNGKLPDYLIND
ncbi:MAG: hypothetical protein WCP85_19630 [Mariniphaga sp.]